MVGGLFGFVREGNGARDGFVRIHGLEMVGGLIGFVCLREENGARDGFVRIHGLETVGGLVGFICLREENGAHNLCNALDNE